jgi:hypothetical protein
MKHPETKQELSEDDVLRELVKMFPLKFWLEGVTTEQLLAGLTPEKLADLVAHLPPEILDAAKKRSS